jgi:hypothetical protein
MDRKAFEENTILAIDSFLHPKMFAQIRPELDSLTGWQPEVDHPDYEPVGMSCNLSENSITYQALHEELRKLFAGDWKIDRIYVNRFQPKEVPRFHYDGEVLTCLLYPDPVEWHPDEHGETQLLVNGEIRGILPLANRLLIFDGRLMHRATAFESQVRHTVATKLKGVTFANIIVPGT